MDFINIFLLFWPYPHLAEWLDIVAPFIGIVSGIYGTVTKTKSFWVILGIVAGGLTTVVVKYMQFQDKLEQEAKDKIAKVRQDSTTLANNLANIANNLAVADKFKAALNALKSIQGKEDNNLRSTSKINKSTNQVLRKTDTLYNRLMKDSALITDDANKVLYRTMKRLESIDAEKHYILKEDTDTAALIKDIKKLTLETLQILNEFRTNVVLIRNEKYNKAWRVLENNFKVIEADLKGPNPTQFLERDCDTFNREYRAFRNTFSDLQEPKFY
ncbi:MAG TPA: hypothetical protein VK563_20395 [Puia sp.]|nr:hypothetical protein [Puia sp.]